MAIELVEVDVPEAAGLVDVPADFERVGFANSGGLVFVDESAEEVATVLTGSRVQPRRVAAIGREKA